VLYLQQTFASSISNASFTGNSADDDRTIISDSLIDWKCQLGRWMQRDGTFTGDLSAPECKPCASGYFGRSQNLSRPSCSGQCSSGHYCEEGTVDPVPCPSGYRMPALGASSNTSCIPCALGQHQPRTGQSDCLTCPVGSFSGDIGQATCESCPRGGYCDEAGADTRMVWEACEAGKYNPEEGSSSSSACLACPMGTFSPRPGAVSNTTCEPCRAGTFAGDVGLDACEPCAAGSSSSEGAPACDPCKPGTYSANRGQGECVPCPYPLSSARGSATCSVCMRGFYLKDSTADPTAIFLAPTDYCKACPPNANCGSPNTTLASFGVDPGYWRASTATARLYTCDGSDTCIGSIRHNGAVSGRALVSREEASGHYCAEGHTGPLCQVCSEDGQYFSLSDRHCVDCPGEWRVAVIAVAVALGAGIVAAAAALLRSEWEPACECLAKLIRKGRAAAEMMKREGLWAKLKIAISLYQCLAAIPSVYVLTVPDSLLGGAVDDLLRGLTVAFRFVDLAVPSGCYGSKVQQLVGAAFTPYALFLLLAVGRSIQAAVAARQEETGLMTLAASGLRSALPAGLFLSFLLLPSIASLIFRSFLCDGFVYDDATGATRSYLQSDYSMECGTPSHRRLERWAYGLIPLWPAGVPALYLAFLLSCRHTLRAGRVTHASASVRFLWVDYRPEVCLWEVLEVLRKLTVTSFVMLIDELHEQARVLVALLLSILFLSLEMWVQPFRRIVDNWLAHMSNLALVVVYLAILVFKVCDGYSEACDQFGFTAEGIFAFFVIFGFSLLILHVLFALTHLMFKGATTTPALRLVSTKSPPVLSKPRNVNFHIFVSHVWKTGQDQTHTLVRQLQLMLPGIRIWLDVVNLEDIGKLEEAVADAAIVLIFLSSGYFASRNCRREVYAALAENKPIETVIEADKDKGGEP